MGKLMQKGKIRGWGQSMTTADEIRRANAVTPLSAVQSEYSMMERMFEKDVIPTCGKLGIGFVAFSPMASGFLSGKYQKTDVYTGDDVRRVITRLPRKIWRPISVITHVAGICRAETRNPRANIPCVDAAQVQLCCPNSRHEKRRTV